MLFDIDVRSGKNDFVIYVSYNGIFVFFIKVKAHKSRIIIRKNMSSRKRSIGTSPESGRSFFFIKSYESGHGSQIQKSKRKKT